MLQKSMKLGAALAVAAMVSIAASSAQAEGTLKVVFLGGNPAQAVRTPSGETLGPAADLAREFGRRLGQTVEIKPIPGPPQVIEEVASGRADIGFVAYEPSRVGTVEFSQTYILVHQTFIVRENSSIRTVADIDRSGQKIAGTTNDSITLRLGRTLKNAMLITVENDQEANKKKLLAGEFDAFSGNRHRMTTWMREMPGTRVLPDNLFSVPQTIVVPKGKPDVLAAVNKLSDDTRASGLIQKSIETNGLIGVEVAPPGVPRN